MYKWDGSGIVLFSSSIDFRESHLKTWFAALVTLAERKKSNVPLFRLFKFRQRSYAIAFSHEKSIRDRPRDRMRRYVFYRS